MTAKQPQKRACATCARLKMKCQWPHVATEKTPDACLRCSRMAIDCSVPTAQSRRKRGKGTRVAQLEQKIDGLVSLLHAGQHIQAQQGQSTLTPDSLPSSHQNRPPSPFQGNATSQTQGPLPVMPIPSAFDSHDAVYHLAPSFQLGAAQAQAHLHVFRETCMPNFPFVVLAGSLTAHELYETDVSLFWAVMSTVAPISAELQPEVKASLRAQVSERVVVRREKSLYLLQAILVYLAWSEWHLFFESQTTPLIQMAQSLVTDLKLDKSTKSITLPSKTLLGYAWETFKPPSTETRTELSTAEKTALLGTYYLSSLNVALHRRGSRPIWTNHHSQCCDCLSRNSEYFSDAVIAVQMETQRILDKALLAMPNLGPDAAFVAPLDMFFNNTSRELKNTIDRASEGIKSSKWLQMSYHVSVMRLHEPMIAMHPTPSSQPRTSTMFEVLKHVTHFFDVYLSLSPAELNYLPTPTLALHAFANYTISRLLICDPTADWDPTIARREIDFHDILKKSGEQLDEADKIARVQGWKRRVYDDGPTIAFEKFASKLSWIADWYLKRISPVQADDETVGEQMSVADDPSGVRDGFVDKAFESAWIDLMSFQDAGLFESFDLNCL